MVADPDERSWLEMIRESYNWRTGKFEKRLNIDGFTLFIWIFAALGVGLILIAGIADGKVRQECYDRGGTVVENQCIDRSALK